MVDRASGLIDLETGRRLSGLAAVAIAESVALEFEEEGIDDRTQIGLLIGVGAGCGLGWTAAWALRSPLLQSVLICALVVSVGLVALTARQGTAEMIGKCDGASYGLTVSVETIASILGVIILRRSGQPGAIRPLIAIWVGLQVLGLWRVSHRTSVLAMAIGLRVVGIFGMSGSSRRRRVVSRFECAVLLRGQSFGHCWRRHRDKASDSDDCSRYVFQGAGVGNAT